MTLIKPQARWTRTELRAPFFPRRHIRNGRVRACVIVVCDVTQVSSCSRQLAVFSREEEGGRQPVLPSTHTRLLAFWPTSFPPHHQHRYTLAKIAKMCSKTEDECLKMSDHSTPIEKQVHEKRSHGVRQKIIFLTEISSFIRRSCPRPS